MKSSRFALLFILAVLSGEDLWAQFSTTTAPTTETTEKRTIKGLEIARSNGGKLGVEFSGVSLRVTFYDKDNAVVAPDAVRITARWIRNGSRTAVLLPAGEGVLQSPPVVQPPYNYVITLVLIGEGDKVLETHSVVAAQIPRG